jgi:hypothetical protein
MKKKTSQPPALVVNLHIHIDEKTLAIVDNLGRRRIRHAVEDLLSIVAGIAPVFDTPTNRRR